MSTINSVNITDPIQRLASNPLQKSIPAAAAAASGPVDTVDLSGVAQPAADNINAAKVASIRQQIEAGTYETDDKLNAAVDKLLNDINS